MSKPIIISAPVMFIWEVIRWIPHPKKKRGEVRCTMLLSAPSIEHVWEYLAADRADERTEIVAILRGEPIIATITP